MISNNSSIRRRLITFKLGAALLGVATAITGALLLSASWNGAGFLAGFLLITGVQIFFWVIGIRLEILGNVTDSVFDSQGEAEDSRHASSAIQQ